MLLQALANHLGGLPCLKILVISDQLVLLPQLILILLLQRPLSQLALGLLVCQPAFQLRNLRRLARKLLFLLLYRLGDGKLLLGLVSGKPGPELFNRFLFLKQLCVLCRQRSVKFLLLFHPRKLKLAVLPFRQIRFPPPDLLFKFLIPDLPDNLRIAGFIHRKDFPAVRASDLLHNRSSLLFPFLSHRTLPLNGQALSLPHLIFSSL